jgi:hypothetical protein
MLKTTGRIDLESFCDPSGVEDSQLFAAGIRLGVSPNEGLGSRLHFAASPEGRDQSERGFRVVISFQSDACDRYVAADVGPPSHGHAGPVRRQGWWTRSWWTLLQRGRNASSYRVPQFARGKTGGLEMGPLLVPE